jgi:hypothetical protein
VSSAGLRVIHRWGKGSTVAATVNRGYSPRTTRLLSEFLALTYPTAQKTFEFRLGSLNPQILAMLSPGVKVGLAGITRGYADALVILPGEAQLWEAKEKISDAAIGQLEGYRAEWPNTPEAAQYAHLPLTVHLLVAQSDPIVEARAAAKGIIVHLYNPSWFVADQIKSSPAGVNPQAGAAGAS